MAYKQYIATLKRARSEYMYNLEKCRLSNPRDFWSFLKPKKRDVVISAEKLISHYTSLLDTQAIAPVREEGIPLDI